MENNLQRDIDFAIHLAMLKMLLESGAISEEEHRLAVSKLREKTNSIRNRCRNGYCDLYSRTITISTASR